MSDDEFEFLGLDKKELLGVGNLAGHYANNQKLKDIQGRGPACPHCRGNLADSGVKVCMHCGRDVVWDYGRALTPAEARELIEARKTAEKQVYFLFRSTRLETNPEQIKKNFDSAIAIMESVFDRDRVESLRAKQKDNAKRPAAKAHAAKISAEREKQQLKKKERRKGNMENPNLIKKRNGMICLRRLGCRDSASFCILSPLCKSLFPVVSHRIQSMVLEQHSFSGSLLLPH